MAEKNRVVFYTLDELNELWRKLYCDGCEKFRQDIVRQNTMDGKLVCRECWEEMVNRKEVIKKMEIH